MEFLSNIWIWILSAIGGISFAGIITAILYGSIKGAFNRTIQRLNVEKVAESVVNKQMERIKKVSFSQNIQPIVESELKKIAEDMKNDLLKELKENQRRYDLMIEVLEKFYAYFDDSLVSDVKKQELKEALEKAKCSVSQPDYIDIKEIVIEEPKETPKTEEKSKKAKIER